MTCKKCKTEPAITYRINKIKLCKSCFIKYIEKKVRKTINKFKLFNHKDKIAVAASGGKDSTTCLYILNKLGYKVEALTINAFIGNYTKKNLENLKKFCKEYKIKLNEISFKKEFGYSLCYITSTLKSKGLNYNSCMVCGVLKRFLLNKYAKKLKFDCLATGHNLDDEAQTAVMNIFRNDYNLLLRQGPITGVARDEAFVKRVKPLYLCTEEEIKLYSKLKNFPVNYDICPCSEDSYRREILNILDNFEKEHPDVKYNIINFYLEAILPLKNKLAKKQNIGRCELCKNPSNRNICKKCEILLNLKKLTN